MFDEDYAYHVFNNENQTTYVCQHCERQFRANRARGRLAFCEDCADAIENGYDMYE